MEDMVEDKLHDASEGDEDNGSDELADVGANGSRLKGEVFEELEGGREASMKQNQWLVWKWKGVEKDARVQKKT